MTSQEIYDRVKTHLLAQGRRATKVGRDGIRGCVYRAEDGAKCAVGYLIPDEVYDPRIEGVAVVDRTVEEVLRKSGVDPGTSRMLLSALQWLHDSGEVKDWPERLKKVALAFGLEP